MKNMDHLLWLLIFGDWFYTALVGLAFVKEAKPMVAASDRGFGIQGRRIIASDVESPSMLPLLLLLSPPLEREAISLAVAP